MNEPNPNYSAKIARRMSFAAWIVLLSLAFVFFDRYLTEKYEPNRNLSISATGQVVLNMNAQGHYEAPGLINGVPVYFLLDTGATRVAIPEHIANKIGLRKGFASESMTANGPITVYDTMLSSVQLGGIYAENISASINPNDQTDVVLLGMSFLRQFSLQQKDGVLTIQ